MKTRLDQQLVQLGLVRSRSQAESYIKLGDVTVNGKGINKPGFMVNGATDQIQLRPQEQYVSRAALKLASVAAALQLDFRGKTVLDVGSSTGGFTDYALKHGAKKVIAVEVGTAQLYPALHGHPQIELHEKTDIRDFRTVEAIDIIVADVSFISLRDILPSLTKLSSAQTQLVMMVKPQFEAAQSALKHKGVVKNDTLRRQILKDFETWSTAYVRIVGKADSAVAGAKGNRERFYLMRSV